MYSYINVCTVHQYMYLLHFSLLILFLLYFNTLLPDVTYSDPLGPLPERTKPGAIGRENQRQQLDELDEPLDDLLPQ